MNKVTHKLPDLCTIQYGYAFDSKYFTESTEGVPLIRIRDVKRGFSETFYSGTFSDEYVVKKGDLLVGMDGEFNIARWQSDNALLNQRVCRIVSNDKVDEEYLRHLLSIKLKEIEARTSFVTVKHLSAKELNNLELTVHSLDKQHEISKFLGVCEHVIEFKQKQLVLLDELIKARFVELFGDPLDEEKATEYFTNCVIFNPKKTEVKELQDVSVSFVPMECVGVDGSFSIKEKGTVADYYKGYTYFKDGDVLLAKITPCFENGKVAIAENCENGIGFGTTEFHVSRPIPGVSNSQWIKYLLKNKEIHELATINMTGSAGQKRIQTPFFDKLKVCLPPIDRQEQFAEFVTQIDKSKLKGQLINYNLAKICPIKRAS